MERTKNGKFLKGHKNLYNITGKKHSRYKHGFTKTPIYKKWEAMKRRCLNKNEKAYKHYGGRGIKVCDKWINFEGFYDDMSGSFKPGLSLERIDNDGDYCKKNCKWITMFDQMGNKRGVKLYSYNGESKSLFRWEKELGFKKGTIRNRIINLKWSLNEALTTNPKKKKKPKKN